MNAERSQYLAMNSDRWRERAERAEAERNRWMARWEQAAADRDAALAKIASRNADQARFWRKVDRTDSCWLWTAVRTPLSTAVLLLIAALLGQIVIGGRWGW